MHLSYAALLKPSPTLIVLYNHSLIIGTKKSKAIQYHKFICEPY